MNLNQLKSFAVSRRLTQLLAPVVRNGDGQISHSLPSLIASYLRLIYAEAISDPLPCAVSRYVRLERDRQSVLLKS
jgi:hypothetical protein